MSSERSTRWEALDDEALGSRVQMLSSGIEPTDVDLVDHVRSRLDNRTHRGRTVGIAAAVVLLAIALVTAFTPARTAVADWLGLGSTSVDIVDELPAAAPAIPPSGAPPGHDTTHESIRHAVRTTLGLDIALPSRDLVGDPIGWSIDTTDEASELTVAWGDFITTATSEPDPFTRKLTTSSGALTRGLTINGEPALWIEGEHVRIRDGVTENVASTLLWVSGGVEYRLSGDLELAEALDIASSFD